MKNRRRRTSGPLEEEAAKDVRLDPVLLGSLQKIVRQGKWKVTVTVARLSRSVGSKTTAAGDAARAGGPGVQAWAAQVPRAADRASDVEAAARERSQPAGPVYTRRRP